MSVKWKENTLSESAAQYRVWLKCMCLIWVGGKFSIGQLLSVQVRYPNSGIIWNSGGEREEFNIGHELKIRKKSVFKSERHLKTFYRINLIDRKEILEV